MRRRFLGLHLATWGAIALVSGVMVWLNLRSWAKTSLRGWPEFCYVKYSSGYSFAGWECQAASVDAIIALAIVAVCGFICEWLLRFQNRPANAAPLFQFHLSTYMILMLFLSICLMLNCTPMNEGALQIYGFPFPCYRYRYGEWSDYHHFWAPADYPSTPSYLAANIILCLALLLAVAFALEWAIRRGKAQTSPPGPLSS